MWHDKDPSLLRDRKRRVKVKFCCSPSPVVVVSPAKNYLVGLKTPNKQTNKQTNTTLQVRIHVLPTGTENYPPHYYFILFYLPTLYQSTANKQLVNALQAMIKILVTSLEILVY